MNAVPLINRSVPTRQFVDRDRLPYNLEYEVSVLGGIILRNDLLAKIPSLEPSHFYDARNRVVFSAIRALDAAAQPIDTVTLEGEIEKAGKLEAIGGVGYLGELALRVPTAENVVHYAKGVFDRSKLRELALEAEKTIQRVYENNDEVDEIIAAARVACETIERSQRATNGSKLITIPQSLEELEHLSRAPIFETPFPTLNEALGFGGLLGTQVYTVAAGTGRGKTTWIATIARYAAHINIPVIVATWEMKPGYFIARSAAGIVGCSSNAILRGEVDMRLVNQAMPYGRYFMLHKPTLLELRRAVAEVTQRFGVAPLVFVDYMQKLASFIAKGMVRPDLRMATSEASESLLEIADESKAAIIAVSSCGRGNNKKLATPRKVEPYELVDVAKESGDVEYDGAGLIVLSLEKENDGEDRVATITVAKARFGREMHIEARYNGARGIWTDLGQVGSFAPPMTAARSTATLRKKLAAALHDLGAVGSKDAIAKAAKMKAAACRSEIDAMIDCREIEKTAGGFRLTEAGRDLLTGDV
ncbi:MAG: hypothetical protein NT062_18290 [Proteobacteria bacterium]|nr:hypothetical protein [Pseudomonadota bacterium]